MRGYRKRSLWKVILLLSITALEGLAFGAKAREASSGALVQAGAFSPKEPLLVSLLDGKVVAVDRDTGRQLWTFDSGPPLLSVSGTADDKQDSEDSSARSPVHSVIPSVHGKLYGYRQQGPFTRGLEELPVTIPELATMGPSWAPDGTEVLGSSSSSVFRVDALTGQQLRGYREAGGKLTQGKQEDTNRAASALGEDEEEIFIGSAFTVGRQDFSIRSMDPVTGKERWNVTYSRLGISGSPGIASPELMGLEVWDQGMMLGLRDSKTGVRSWESHFVMPVISAFLPSGAEISLSQAAAPPLALPEAPSGGTTGRSGEDMMLVGRLGDSLFAMPAPHGHGSTGIAEPRIVDYPMNLDGCLGDEVSGSLIPMPTVAARDLWTCPLGEHPVTRPLPQESPLFLPLPETQNVTENAAARGNIPPEEDCLARKTTMGRLWCYLFHAGVISILIWVMMLGAVLLGGLSFAGPIIGVELYWFNKPRLLARVDRSQQHEGIITLKMDYTGTTQEARQARKEALQNEMQSRASTPQQSSIRDHTGSGVGNNPDDHKPDDPKQSKQSKRRSQRSRGPRYSNRRNGIIREEDAGEDSDGYPSQAGDSDEDADADAAIDNFRRNSSAASASHAPEQANGRSSQGSQGSRPGVNRVGRMEVGPEILGYGSSGTLVFEGTLDGRPIAVKRILCQFYELARKEIGALILSDEHPNIVRCFAMEEDSEFVYLALERCKQSLADLVTGEGGSVFLVDEAKHPTPFCIQLMEEAGQGVVALHQRGIVHRDIKPQNILLTDSRRAKVSDMGLCKRLAIDQSSFESRGPGGSSGWQAPEQLFSRSGEEVRQGKSVDVFSFGLVLFYCLTAGRHAFGESYERDFNIMQGRAKLQELSHLKEAEQLLRSMLTFKPKGRPSMRAVMSHPFWWSSHQRLSFLIDMSDRMENEDREENQSLLQSFENCSRSALGTGPWMARFDGELIENLGRYRKYNQSSLRDLLRVIRNKHNHFRELPESLQAKLGPLPQGYFSYFESRFPNLLMTTYAFGLQHCAEEPMFAKYYPPEAQDPPMRLDIIAGRLPQAPLRPSAASSTTTKSLSKEERTSSAPLPVALQLPTVQEADEAVLRAQSEPDRERARSLSSATSAAQAQPGALPVPRNSDSTGRAQHGSPSQAQSQMSGMNGHGMARQQPGDAQSHSQSRQSVSSMSHRTSSPSRHLPFPPGQNGYPPPPPQGLPPLHRSSPTASIWSSSASFTGSDWSSYVHQQQPPYWNAAQTALLHSAMAGAAHMQPGMQQGMQSSMQQSMQPGMQQGIMAGGPNNISRMRGGRSMISEDGHSSGNGFQHHSPGQNGAEARHMQMQPPSLHGLQAPGGNGGMQPGMPDQASSMPARSQPGKAPSFPSRPGEPVCDFFSKTGHCRFGEGCRFDHPPQYAVQLNSAGLPLRPGEPACSHHEKTGQCKYGPACKFDHPER